MGLQGAVVGITGSDVTQTQCLKMLCLRVGGIGLQQKAGEVHRVRWPLELEAEAYHEVRDPAG